jgi:superfamily II DNA or RNA helicase
MELTINASFCDLTGPKETLDAVDRFFTFRDKAAESQIQRFKKTLKFKDRSIAAQNGGELPDEWLKWKAAKLKELQAVVVVHCCKWNDENATNALKVPTGLVPRLLEFLAEKQQVVVVKDKRNFDLPRRILKGEPPPSLRKPQVAAIQELTRNDRGVLHGLGLARMATGVGKTALAQELIRKLGHRTIFLVPSLPILKQTIKRYEAAFGSKNVKAYGGGKKDIGYITVATYQSVYKADPEDFQDVDAVIADECHHVSADTFYDVMMNKLGHCVWRIGLTAFEERADGSTQLIESAVGPVVYKYDAPEAIADGYLAQPTFMVYDVFNTYGTWPKMKEDKKTGKRVVDRMMPSTQYNGEDQITAYRNWVLGNDILNNFVAQVTSAFVRDGKSVLILVDEIEHGVRLRNLIPDAGFVQGGGKDNESIMKEFNKRNLKVVIGTSTIGEGADTVPVDVLFFLQGGASKSGTLQANGRALRNETDENGVARKPTALIIDFNFPLCDLLARHSMLREQVHKTLGKVIHTPLK